jgi:uncharacterized protein YndB with AHSA1/START domain
MQKEIKHRWVYEKSPEEVWKYLTNSELIAQWLMPNDFVLQAGHEFQFRIRPIPEMDFNGIVYCKVVEIVPFKRLSYTWKTGPADGKITVDSLVVWTLSTKGHGTELSLEHTGFTETINLSLYDAMDHGWLENMQKITHLLNEALHGATTS